MVDEFRIRFDLDRRLRHDIDRWIKFAIEKKVKKLELNLSRSFGANFSHESRVIHLYGTRYRNAHVPQLVKFSIQRAFSDYNVEDFCKFSRYHQVGTLALHSLEAKNKMEILEVPVVANIKQLKLIAFVSRDETSLLALTSLIEAAPFLRSFIFQLQGRESFMPRTKQKPKRCFHQHLKMVEIHVFPGKTIEDELVLYINENAINLEKIILDTRGGPFIGSSLEFEEIRRKKAATYAKKFDKIAAFPRSAQKEIQET
ncbi:unnamed protein product [Dovyalis caffra]|uniref:At1g61320/AtMIF1 LRR domain-containing protein n=1 Tax=Dovyalis caffra TaxID=77055 RepID=A0AAV1SIR1_9ROSI|nr:unnamed protein product [Dovyalis caffra]